jgi:hypothetical protein
VTDSTGVGATRGVVPIAGGTTPHAHIVRPATGTTPRALAPPVESHISAVLVALGGQTSLVREAGTPRDFAKFCKCGDRAASLEIRRQRLTHILQ